MYQGYLLLKEEIKSNLDIIELEEWKKASLSGANLCFFEKIEIYPFYFDLSFQKTETREKQFFLKTAAGQAFMNCDEAPIKLNVTIK